MENLLDCEEMTTCLCRYNPSYRIHKCRIIFQLVKCKQNHSNSEVVPCDVNATHIVHKHKLHRYQHCKNRNKFVVKIAEIRHKISRYVIPKIEKLLFEENPNL